MLLPEVFTGRFEKARRPVEAKSDDRTGRSRMVPLLVAGGGETQQPRPDTWLEAARDPTIDKLTRSQSMQATRSV